MSEEDGHRKKHILAGIVSTKLGSSCKEQSYTIFSNIAVFVPWIEKTIRENGGMASCGYNISAPPSLGTCMCFNNY